MEESWKKKKGSFGILIVFGADRHRVGIKENKIKILYNFVLEGSSKTKNRLERRDVIVWCSCNFCYRTLSPRTFCLLLDQLFVLNQGWFGYYSLLVAASCHTQESFTKDVYIYIYIYYDTYLNNMHLQNLQ